MRVRHADVETSDFDSPKGRFGCTFREYFTYEDIGCPFDLEHVTLKAGKRNFPFRSHGSLWEL